MLNFNGSTGMSGTSNASFSFFAAYTLMHMNILWIGVCFLLIALFNVALVVSTLTRYFINRRRARVYPTYRMSP